MTMMMAVMMTMMMMMMMMMTMMMMMMMTMMMMMAMLMTVMPFPSQIPVPDNIDILLVEQEVIGDDRTALAAVVEADVELMALRAEEAEITAKMAAVTVEDSKGTLPHPPY